MSNLEAVEVLEQRLEFLESITEVAVECNWSAKDVEELHDHLLDELTKIDNIMLKVYEESGDSDLAFVVREAHMEDLRHWLGLILGIKIKYV